VNALLHNQQTPQKTPFGNVKKQRAVAQIVTAAVEAGKKGFIVRLSGAPDPYGQHPGKTPTPYPLAS
jgi:hypothetical protein